MNWHLILMIVLTIGYFALDIYMFSTSITIQYRTESKNRWQTIRRNIKDFVLIIKKYFEWYGFGWFMIKHSSIVWIAWLIYGGIFIW